VTGTGGLNLQDDQLWCTGAPHKLPTSNIAGGNQKVAVPQALLAAPAAGRPVEEDETES